MALHRAIRAARQRDDRHHQDRPGSGGLRPRRGRAAAATIIHGHLRNLLLGMNPLDIELLWDQMYSSGAMYGRRGVFVMALSGVDNALWDIAGKTMDQPVYRLLGGTTKQRVPSYFTSADPEPGLALGFEHFKLPIRDGVFEGRAGMDRIEGVLREARQAIGPDRSLMIDCGLRWNDVAYVKEIAKRLEPVRLYFIEEPLSPDDVLGYAELVREVEGTLIASGEHEYTQYGFEMLFHHKAVEVVQPDVTWCGGVTALRKIAAMCATRGLTFIPHRGGSLFGLPLVLSTPGAPLAESFGTGDASSDLMLAITAPFEKGHYLPPEGPGFGTQITDELIRKHKRD
ncbi:MAG: enolase C-terminal domain-like protein [Bryobacterales bacterium]